jgi:hypothetical protein
VGEGTGLAIAVDVGVLLCGGVCEGVLLSVGTDDLVDVAVAPAVRVDVGV